MFWHWKYPYNNTKKDFTSLNKTFIQPKVSPQKYVLKGFKFLKYLRDFFANHGFFFLVVVKI